MRTAAYKGRSWEASQAKDQVSNCPWPEVVQALAHAGGDEVQAVLVLVLLIHSLRCQGPLGGNLLEALAQFLQQTPIWHWTSSPLDTGRTFRLDDLNQAICQLLMPYRQASQSWMAFSAMIFRASTYD